MPEEITKIENPVDYVPDSESKEKGTPEEKIPKISCQRCIHKDVCYFLTKLYDDAQCFKMSGVCELPYSPHILATTCKKYELKDGRMPNKEKEEGRQDTGLT